MKVSDLVRYSHALKVKTKARKCSRYAKIWVFGEWFGQKCMDNSLCFANFVANRNPDIQCYWITDEQTNTLLLDPKISILVRDSQDAMEMLQKCGVAVLSQTFQDFNSDGFNYTEGAISVQLWHGVPWKKIGHDGNYAPSKLRALYYKFLNYLEFATLYASPSDAFDEILRTAFGVSKERIVHAGYARNSVFYHNEMIKEAKSRILYKLHSIQPDYDFSKSKIISYMPTFRSNPYGKASSDGFSFEELRSNELFMDYIKKNNAIVIEKAHFVRQTRDGINNSCGNDNIYSINDITAQDLLCASDLLVTDYSGAFFDFLILDRPIVHYIYDYDYYRTKDRGLYYKKEDVIAGEEADNEEQLVNAIIRNLNDPDLFQDRRHHIRGKYMKYDTEESCEVLYQEIMKELNRRNFNESTNS